MRQEGFRQESEEVVLEGVGIGAIDELVLIPREYNENVLKLL